MIAVRIPPGAGYFSFIQNLQTGTDTPVKWTGEISPGVITPRCEADHFPAPNNEVRNDWNFTSTSSYSFMTCTGTTLHFTSTDNNLFHVTFWGFRQLLIFINPALMKKMLLQCVIWSVSVCHWWCEYHTFETSALNQNITSAKDVYRFLNTLYNGVHNQVEVPHLVCTVLNGIINVHRVIE